MRNISMLTFLVVLLLAGCSPAFVTASKWDSVASGVNAQTRCERVDLRDKEEMDRLFPKYDGWKLVYLSEYTTSHKLGTDAAVCFERSNAPFTHVRREHGQSWSV